MLSFKKLARDYEAKIGRKCIKTRRVVNWMITGGEGEGDVPVPKTCGICLEDFTEEDTPTGCYNSTGTGCGHDKHFHESCIQEWAQSGNNTCPLCRAPCNVAWV